MDQQVTLEVIKILGHAKLHFFQKFEIKVTKYSSMSIT
jgi:hypothetical protein